MFRHTYIAVMLGFTFCWACAVPVRAQQGNPQDLFVDARNKIGVLRYCRDKGHVGQITADFAIEAIEAGPGRTAGGDRTVKERGARLEKLGEAGFWGAQGDQDLASVAQAFDTTLGALCKELAATAMKLSPNPVVKQAVTVAPVPPPAPKPPVREIPAARPKAPEARPTSAIQPIAPPPPAPPLPVEARQVATPARPAPRPWIDEPLEVNKWRLDRRARPWGWD